MRVYFLSAASALLLVGLLNWTVDPARRFAKRDAVDVARWAPGTTLTAPADFDDRRFRLTHARRVDPPGVLVLGSSRSLVVHSGMLRAGAGLFSAGLTGATAQDHVLVWETLRRENKTPRVVLLLADPWLFNALNGQARWLEHAALCESFLRRRSSMEPGLRKLWLRYAKKRAVAGLHWVDFQDLLGWGLLRVSVAESLRPAAADAAAGRWRWDGSREESPAEAARTPQDALAAARAYASGSVYQLEPYAWDPDAERLLSTLAEDIRASGTEFVVAEPPYHPETRRLLLARPEMRERLERATAALRRLPGASYCDSADPRELGCGPEDFIDGMHMRPFCARKVVSRCLPALAVPALGAGNDKMPR